MMRFRLKRGFRSRRPRNASRGKKTTAAVLQCPGLGGIPSVAEKGGLGEGLSRMDEMEHLLLAVGRGLAELDASRCQEVEAPGDLTLGEERLPLGDGAGLGDGRHLGKVSFIQPRKEERFFHNRCDFHGLPLSRSHGGHLTTRTRGEQDGVTRRFFCFLRTVKCGIS